jgi:putative hydrolase of the HAD superfamily
MTYTTLFFDLDDTLYASSNGLWEAIRERMNAYMAERLGLPWDQVLQLRRSYYETYGTTLRGLQRHYQVDAQDYLNYVHDLPLEKFLEPAPELRTMLLSLPQRRWIFTNADADHARRVLSILGCADCFEGIIDVLSIEFACKPERIAYLRALKLAGQHAHADILPGECVMLDDSVSNLMAAREMGFATVLVSLNGSSHPAVMYSLQSLIDLPRAMPELWGSAPQARPADDRPVEADK